MTYKPLFPDADLTRWSVYIAFNGAPLPIVTDAGRRFAIDFASMLSQQASRTVWIEEVEHAA